MNCKRLLTVLLVMLWCFTHIFAQDDSDWYYNKPISNISFKGLNNIKASDMEGITHAFLGKRFDDEIFSDLLNRIFALNYFEDVNPVALPGDKDYKTVKIELNVVEYPVVSDLKIIGYKKLRGSELRDAISTKEKSIYDEEKRLADEQVLKNLYLSRGFSNAKIRSEAIETDDGFKVTFYVKEGSQTVVKDIVFTGNTIATERTLKSKLASKPHRLFQKGAFQEALIEQDKKAIIQYYGDNGYIDAKIINATQTSEFNEKQNREEITLQYNIHEGSQYTYGGTTIQGNRVFTKEELLSMIKLKEGAVFNATKFQEGISDIQNKYFSNGYWSNNFVPQIDKDSNNKTIAYRIYIQEGLRSHVESITIKGNKRTREEVIRREIPIESGDIFSNEKVNTGIRNLYNLQYFKQVVPDVKPGSEENLVDVSFSVEEQSTRSVQFGLTFSGTANAGEFPISLFGGFEDTNLFGSGKTGSISATLSTTEQSITLGYGQNWIFDLPISNYVSFGYTRAIRSTPRNVLLPDGTFDYYSYYMKYTQHKFTLSDTISRRWTPNFATVRLSTGITSSLLTNIYDDSLYVPASTAISEYHNTWNPVNSIFVQLALDNRDNYYNPTKGWFASQRFTWFGLMPKGKFIFPDNFGETEFFLRSATKAEGYYTLFNIPVTDSYTFKTILRGYSGLSMQRPYMRSKISETNELYLDGMVHTRGWEIYDQDEGRGNLTWVNSAEIRIPVFPNAIAFDLFFDASMVKDDMKDIKDFQNMDDWYFSYGPGLSLTMQQLPLRLFLASNFKIESGDVVLKDRDGDTLHNWLSTWHFVLSINMPNQ